VQAYDPKAMENSRPLLPVEVVLCGSALEALEGAHAAVLATEWQEFVDLSWGEVAELMTQPRLIFDGRNVLDGRLLMRLGFKYRGVGRSGPRWKGD